MTAEMTVRFLHPVSCRGLLQLDASLQAQRRHTYQLSAELSCAGTVLARSDARFFRRKCFPAPKNRAIELPLPAIDHIANFNLRYYWHRLIIGLHLHFQSPSGVTNGNN